MQNIIIDKPYQPVPPYRGRFWTAVLGQYLAYHLKRRYGVIYVECRNAERLRQSIVAGNGIILAPNHCRDPDPLVLGALSRAVGKPFFLLASWHLFMQGRMMAWLLRRAGAFSIYREGMDRAAVNTAIEILEKAERPLVIFPEGVISHHNDRLNTLLDGTALIARSAAKKRAKQAPAGKVVVHPIALRYAFGGNLKETLDPVLDEIERRLSWRPRADLPLIERIYRVGNGLLSLKEIEYIGQAQTGTIAERLGRLIDTVLVPLEMEWLGGKREPHVVARVKGLRTAILPDMVKGDITEEERQRRWRQLADVYLAQQLAFYPPDYIRSNPTPERLLETVERFEEDLTDGVRSHRPLTAVVQVGEAIEVNPIREQRGSADPLMQKLEEQLEAMLGIVENPPKPDAAPSATAIAGGASDGPPS